MRSDFNESTRIALKHIEDILKIENEIEEIKSKLRSTKNYGFIDLNSCYKSYLIILVHIRVLDERFNLLIKIKLVYLYD